MATFGFDIFYRSFVENSTWFLLLIHFLFPTLHRFNHRQLREVVYRSRRTLESERRSEATIVSYSRWRTVPGLYRPQLPVLQCAPEESFACSLRVPLALSLHHGAHADERPLGHRTSIITKGREGIFSEKPKHMASIRHIDDF